MKKTRFLSQQTRRDHKGFSLVELIIVIAIMAILVGLVGTQVIPYLNKAKEAKDLQILNGYSTNAVAAYSSICSDLSDDTQTNGISFDVYDRNATGDAKKLIDAMQSYSMYTSLDECKSHMSSKEGKNCNGIIVDFDFPNHIMTVTAKDTTLSVVRTDFN